MADMADMTERLSPLQEGRNGERLATLEPETARLARAHLEACRDEGILLLVVQGYRSDEEQARLYASGRTAPGRIVTNASPGDSWHNYRRAYDVAVIVDGAIAWDAEGKYRRAGELGESIGLTWGGRFKGLGDLGHFEYHPGLTLKDMRRT